MARGRKPAQPKATQPAPLTREAVEKLTAAECAEILDAHGIEAPEGADLDYLQCAVEQAVFVDLDAVKEQQAALDEAKEAAEASPPDEIRVLCVADNVWTSRGQMFEGDEMYVPTEDAEALRGKVVPCPK